MSERRSDQSNQAGELTRGVVTDVASIVVPIVAPLAAIKYKDHLDSKKEPPKSTDK